MKRLASFVIRGVAASAVRGAGAPGARPQARGAPRQSSAIKSARWSACSKALWSTAHGHARRLRRRAAAGRPAGQRQRPRARLPPRRLRRFFDVTVPSFDDDAHVEPADARSERPRARQRVGALQTHVRRGDPNLEQALKRVELQVKPGCSRGSVRRVPARARSPVPRPRSPATRPAPPTIRFWRSQRSVSRRGRAGVEGRHAGRTAARSGSARPSG